MKKDDAFYLRICYAAFGLIIFFVVSKAAGMIGIRTGWTERFYEWYPVATTILSVVAGVGSVVFLATNKERHEYFLASIGELRKVSWPSGADTRRMTLVVCVVVGIFAVILSIFDFLWGHVLGLFLS